MSSKRAVIYVRISKDRDEEETSTGTQEAEARALCERRGWTVAKVESDIGRSAFKRGTRRPGFDAALDIIDRGHAEVLVVWKLDRLHRGLVDSWQTWSRIADAGGELASVTDDLDTSRSAGRMMVGLLAGFAEMESEVKSDRAKAWHDGRRAKVLPPTGYAPFGYERVDGELVVIEEQAETLRRIVGEVLEGRSLRSVGRELDMVHAGVRKLLSSPTISGRREIDGVLVSGQWPAIISPELSDEIRSYLADPTRRTTTGGERRWMLSGLAGCECGGRLGSKPHEAGHRYACRECAVSIKAELLDRHVTESLFAVVTPEAWEAARRAGRAPAIDTSELGERMQEIAVDYAAGRIDRAVYEAAKAEQARIIADAELEPVELPDLADLEAGWPSLDASDRMLVVSAFVSDITLARGRGTPPSRVSMSWRA